MTIRSSASAILEDLIESGSFLRTQVSACDYGILDNTAGCAVVLQPGNSTSERIGYGGGLVDTWEIIAECYLRDTGNAEEILTRVWDIHDAVKSAVTSGSNVNDITGLRQATVSNMVRPRDLWAELAGNDFAVVYINIEVKEDP